MWYALAQRWARAVGRRTNGLLLAVAVVCTPALAQEKRVALIVGSSAYKSVATLRNPVADAAAMQVVLQRMGFQLFVGQDLTYAAFQSKVLEFSKAATGADIALFFYAGHGVQYGDQNYLLPIDIEVKSQGDVTTRSVALNEVLEKMAKAAKASVIFLDACRDSPQFRTVAKGSGKPGLVASLFSRGLAPVPGGQERFIGFAAAPGAVAADGAGNNSPFTSALLSHIGKPNTAIGEMFTSVTAAVLFATQRRQRPEQLNSLSKPLYLNPADGGLTEVKEIAPGGEDRPPDLERFLEAEFWRAIKDSSDLSAFETYLKDYPKGRFVNLARRRIEELKVAAAARPRPLASDTPSADKEFIGATGAARITKEHTREEAQRSARALARARLIQAKTGADHSSLPTVVESTVDAASFLAHLGRGIPHEEVWTTHPVKDGEARIELRAKVRPIGPLAEPRLSGSLDTTDVIARKPIRLRVTARRDAAFGVFAWQADDTVLRLYPERGKGEPILINKGQTVSLPRQGDSYVTIASDNMPGETMNHEAWIIVTGASVTSAQLERLVPLTVSRAVQNPVAKSTSSSEFLNRLAAVQDPELEILVLPYTVRAER